MSVRIPVILGLFVVLVTLAGGAGAVAADRPATALAKKPKPKLPTRLWYRVSLRYSGTERWVGQQAKKKAKDESVVRMGVELRPQTAVLLRRGPGRSFSILRGRPLVGRVTSWSWVYEEDIPGCTHLEFRREAMRLGRADGLLSALPSDDGSAVTIGIENRTGHPGPSGEVTERWVGVPWFCNLAQLRRAGSDAPPLGVRVWSDFNEPCADNPAEFCFGLRKQVTEDRTPVYFHLRVGPATALQLPIQIIGFRFGQQSVERIATNHWVRNFVSANGDMSGTKTIDERWTFTFDRCPTPRPC